MENQKTLYSIASHPLRKTGGFGVSAAQFAAKLLSFNKNGTQAQPDNEALRFYALNQIIGLMSSKFTVNEDLPEWGQRAVAMYSKELVNQHSRMVWYTFLVVSREWRHLKNLGTVSTVKSQPYTPGLKALHPHISDSSSEPHLNVWLKQVPQMSLVDYCKCLTHSFNTGTWSGGYGGKPWGNIAQTLLNYVDGKISAEVFIDTAYTLAHNNGPMFNKGMLYDGYTGAFKTILDVQRSGQVCESLREGQFAESSGELHTLITECADALNIGEYVDWYKVEALGALQQYPHKKAAQDKKYGKKAVALVNGAPVKIVSTFEWYPGKEVDIFKRELA